MVFLVISIGLVAYSNFKHLGQDLDEIVMGNWPASIYIKDMRLAVGEHSIAHSKLIEGSLAKQLGEPDEHVGEHYASANDLHAAAMERWDRNIEKLKEIQLYQEEAESATVDMNILRALFRELEAAYRIEDHELAARTKDQYNNFLEEMDAGLMSVESIIDQRMDAALVDVDSDISKAVGVIILLTIIIAVLELAVTLSMMRVERKKSEEISRLKDEFVFVATHELRSPVSVIGGYLEMILKKDVQLDERVRANLLEIKRADERLKTLVQDLLEVARAEAGKIKISVSPQRVEEAVKSAYAELKLPASRKAISLTHEHKQGLPEVLADSHKLQEVLVNLIGNAIKYTKTKGNVTVSHELKDDFLITHVSDTGIGLSKEEQKHMFEKFWRSEKREVRQIAGTGLGLFITRELVKKMKGKIWVESEEGKGSIFSFQLPIVKS